jgi:molybdopterin converting factor subunit 1
MTITVRLFASCAEAAGASQTTVSVQGPATVRAVRDALARVLTGAALAIAARSVVAVNAAYAHDDQVIQPGDEVALIPPVAGG